MNLPPDEPEIPVPGRKALAFLNGKLIPYSQAKLPLYDAGIVLGATVTDFVRTFRQQLYCLDDHLERFYSSCQLTEIPLELSKGALACAAEELVARNAREFLQGQELALILIATPGCVPFYAGDLPAAAGPTLAMHTVPLDMRRNAAFFRSGACLATPQVRALPNSCIDPRIKHRSRLHWRLAQNEVNSSHPGALALLLDEAGFVTETASANLLIVQNGVVLSPPLDSVLNGISQGIVHQLCDEMGIAFVERRLSLEDCARAEEAFLTNTSFCLAGVRRVNEVDLTWPGPLTERILQAWSEKVGVDIRDQFLQSL